MGHGGRYLVPAEVRRKVQEADYVREVVGMKQRSRGRTN